AGVVDNAGDAVAVSHHTGGDEQRHAVAVGPEELVDLNLDRVLVGLVQGHLELGREAVDLSVGVTAVVSTTVRSEDLRNATDTDTRRDPAEDGCVVRAATEERAPVLGASIFNDETGLLRGGLDGLERGNTVRVVDVVEDAHGRGRTVEERLGTLDV